MPAGLPSGVIQSGIPGHGGKPGGPASPGRVKLPALFPHPQRRLGKAVLLILGIGQDGGNDIAQQRPEMGEQRLYPALVADFYEFDYLLRLHQLTPSVSVSSISLNT